MAEYVLPRSRDHALSLVEVRPDCATDAKCAVINCENAACDGDESVKFYLFPDDPLERLIWVMLMGRVDRTRKPWSAQQSKLYYVCSKHFLGNRRLLLPDTDHYYPSIFPAILNVHCLPQVGPDEEKIALIPRAAGFYRHRRLVEERTTRVTIHREELPELDEGGLKWSQLQDIAYEGIYLPFIEEFNKLVSDLQRTDEITHFRVEKIEERLACVRDQMHRSLRRMLECEGDQSSVNIYNTNQRFSDQTPTGLSARGKASDKPVKKTKTHSFVSGPEGARIPIDVTMPSIIKDWTYTTLNHLKIGQKVLALDITGNWLTSLVSEIDYATSTAKVKLQGSARENSVSLSEVAYGSASPMQIQLGCRVLAGISSPQAGVVMEYPKWQNNNRYLILFENGRWAYHEHRSLFLICKQTSQTWLHVDREIQDTVRDFFTTTEHPLLRVTVGQRIVAEKDNQWFDSEVISLDGNLIEVAFTHYGSKLATEWLYAGSPRLQEIFGLLHPTATTTRKHAKRKVARRVNEPYVEYVDDAIDVITLSDDEDDDRYGAQSLRKNTARKSTAQPAPRTRSQHSAVDKDPGFLGSVRRDEVKPLAQPKEFVPHVCGPSCLPINDSPSKHAHHSPYLMPHLMAWRRLILESSEGKGVIYKAPCGKSLRNETETLHCLLLTESKIKIDQFCFDPEFDAFAIWEPERKNVFEVDITNGEEPYPISFVNGVDTTVDKLVPYWSKRRPTKAAKRTMILDEEFLPCCSCEDECLDRSKCQCQSQTVAISDSISGEVDPEAGYSFRSLSASQSTGIFECNSRCSCKTQCINKVAQNGVQVRMQIFKTLKKGFGVRTVHDIPKGRFLCTYAGTILTDKEAESSGQDTYFAELDYVDIVTQSKEDYESSVSDIEDDFDEPDDSDSESDRKRLDGNALRQLYFGNGDSYVMDALDGGNIGRYFNHSCDPNIFVQNVFVDTHDIRLPWLGFFTDRLIKAGEELTWDYRYEVGSVKGKRLLCYCNSANCRKRLL
ncbi:histone-lysine N-methyltransferase eggless [Galendromus occidentalis]|uniref:Histone-lysine N-methyltransferase eggless n=1 Tax=Galendromus occidentalis TaxID=34638 RepID=A0AAJ6W0R0_9ACAR|nr:histone-lysine N-methyltransferase eggless [Galendromus occidentalis]